MPLLFPAATTNYNLSLHYCQRASLFSVALVALALYTSSLSASASGKFVSGQPRVPDDTELTRASLSENLSSNNNNNNNTNVKLASNPQQRASTSKRIKRVAAASSIDPRSLPSPLPKKSKRARAAANMRLDGPLKRSADVSNATTTPRHQSQSQKRFRTSGRMLATSSSSSSSSTTTTTSSHSFDLNNNNNNSTNTSTTSAQSQERTRQELANDMNNNSIDSGSTNGHLAQTWRQNVNSANGTVDLSQYSQSDVDRLYGDALLVYFKNFNE